MTRHSLCPHLVGTDTRNVPIQASLPSLPFIDGKPVSETELQKIVALPNSNIFATLFKHGKFVVVSLFDYPLKELQYGAHWEG